MALVATAETAQLASFRLALSDKTAKATAQAVAGQEAVHGIQHLWFWAAAAQAA
jgi:hypothetical protein